MLHQAQSNGKGEHYLHSNSTKSIIHYFWICIKCNVPKEPKKFAKLGSANRKRLNVSSVNTIQVPIKKKIARCLYSMLKNFKDLLKNKGRVKTFEISRGTVPTKGF